MDTKRFDEKNLAKHRERCDMIEQLALMEEENRKLRVELGRAKGTAAGWAKKADKRLGHIDECEAALAKRNERISKLEKQVADLRAELEDTNRMLRESDQLGERERAILDMWPRFEDGERVWFGDEVEMQDEIVREVWTFTLDVNAEGNKRLYLNGFQGLFMLPGEPVKRPVQSVLDADGVEINVGDTVWSDDGLEMTVTSLVGELPGHVTAHGDNPPAMHSISPKRLTHTRPDSWERLEEDAEKIRCDIARNLGDFSPSDFADEGDSVQSRVIDLIRRAKALAEVEVERDAD